MAMPILDDRLWEIIEPLLPAPRFKRLPANLFSPKLINGCVTASIA
jgi:hypothetical protein